MVATEQQTTQDTDGLSRSRRRLLHVCETAGAFIEYWGFKSIHGRVWTLLALSKEPISQVEVARILTVSRALVSQAMAELVSYGLVRPKGDHRNAPYEAVMDIWQPTSENKTIINLPATVEVATPNVYADGIEWMHRNFSKRENVILSLHPHNDRGTGVAATELGVLAGADRVEGTLFGNGERTGNVDVITLAMNMVSPGLDSQLDMRNMRELRATAEYCNQLPVHPRHPYAGDLVFTAFSGSHQDAIKKGMADIYDVQPGEPLEGEYETWDVPYLPIDPRHLGRSYEAVIRVNSQSGKGGVAYVLLHEYGLDLPRQLQVDFAKKIQAVTEDTGTEITSYEIHRRFMSAYVEPVSPKVEIIGHRSSSDTLESGTTTMEAKLIVDGKEQMVMGEGNGPIDAFVAALTGAGLFEGKVADYSEHTMGTGSDATAVAYVEIDTGGRDTTWGVGMHESIVSASLRAIVSAVNTLRS